MQAVVPRRGGELALAARAIALLALLLAVLGTYTERWGLDASAGGGGNVRVGERAPDFAARDLAGAPVSLDQFRGRVVVLNFWATWCSPCRVEMPELEAYQTEMGQRIAILGVNMQEPPSTIAPFAKLYGLTFPMLLDQDGAIAATYGVVGLPTSVIVDRSGIVRDRVVGAMTRDGLARRVERLL